jgi:hypothetical protein
VALKDGFFIGDHLQSDDRNNIFYPTKCKDKNKSPPYAQKPIIKKKERER